MEESLRPPLDPCLAPTLAALGDKPRAAIDRLGSLAFRAVQLSAAQPGLRPRELDRSGRRDLLGRLRRVEMAAAGLDLWIPETHLRDAAQVDRAVGAIYAAVELAADLGRIPLSLLLPTRDEATDTVAPILDAVIEKSIRFGVPLADCKVPPSDRADVGVGIDPVTWMSKGRDPIEAVAALADRIRSARLGDLERARLDLDAYRGALQRHGYRGPVVVDLRSRDDPWGELERTAQAWAAAG